MKDFRTCLRGLRAMIRPVWGRIAVTVLIGLVRIGASLAFVWICKKLVDIASGVSDRPIGPAVGILVGVMLLQLAANVGFHYWQGIVEVKTRLKMREELFSHIIHSSWSGREAFHSADAINRMQEDLRVVVDLICERIPDAFVTLCQLVAASVFLMALAPNLVWILLLLMVVAVLGSKMFFRMLRELTDKIRRKDSEIQGHVQENLQHRVLVLTLFGTERVMEKMGFLQDDLKDNTVKRLNYNAIARGFMGFGFMSGYAAAFLWGVFGIRSGAVTFGMMTAFLQLVGQVQRPIADLSRHIESRLSRDEEDYELEVGSAGLGQPFRVRRQYEIHVGKEVETQLHDGHKYHGTLLSVSDEGFQLGILQKVKEEGKKRPVIKEVPTDFRFDDVAYTKYLIKVK